MEQAKTKVSANPEMGARFRAARLALGFPRQIDLTRALGVDASHVSRWEKGDWLPSQPYLERLMQLGVGADWLLHGLWTSLSPRVIQTLLSFADHADEEVRTIARELRAWLRYEAQRDAARRGLIEPDPPPITRYVGGWAMPDEKTS